MVLELVVRSHWKHRYGLSKGVARYARGVSVYYARAWLDGDLLLERRTLQRRIPKSNLGDSQKRLARFFANLMFERKTKAAIRLLTERANGGVLRLGDSNRTVSDVLIDNHPSGQPAHPESIIEDDPRDVHPVLFDSIDASMIRSAALRTTGAAGPSC